MGKVVGSYESVVRGVSEQVPQQRHSGQHSEQVNMLSDPVHGLVRRHGSVTTDEVKLTSVPISDTTQQSYIRNYRHATFFSSGVEYSLVYQAAARPALNTLPFAFCANKDTGKFLTVNVVAPTGAMAPWVNGGVSAVTMAGQFLVLAAKGYAPTYTLTDQYAASSQYGVAQVRTGQYTHTYTVKVKRLSTGVQYSATYTTMASSYPTLLSTSDIPASATDYQKQVNDRVYAYNSAVNKWIGDAAADIQPENIAEKLRAILAAAGFTEVTRQGGTLQFTNCAELTTDDGGDGTSFRAVFNELDDVAKLSSIHYPGKIVRVTTKGAEPFYMLATAENAGLAAGFQPVRWKEGAAQVVTPTSVFALGVIVGSTLHIAATPAALQAASGVTVPGYDASTVGASTDEGAIPYFFGKQITCLTVFQDRLLVIANGVILCSRPGDYFNFFRHSKLTVTQDDPIEMFALGAEDDVIRYSVSYNKDAFLFGDRKQYAISGRVALTPQEAAVSVAANERGAANAQPAVQANLVFYGKARPAASQIGTSKFAASVNQFQLGIFQDTPEAYDISQQLGLYLRGQTTEFAVVSKPHTLVVRTDGMDYGLYIYNYLDVQGSQTRAFDSWHRWEWDQNVGFIIGVTEYKGVLRVYTLRADATDTWVACEEFSLDAALSDSPHFDMQRSAQSYATNVGFLKKATYSPATGAIAATATAGTLKFIGSTLSQYDTLVNSLWPGNPNPPATVGIQFPSFVELTPPYTRDRNDVAIVNGRLVINRYSVSVAETGGMKAVLTNMTSDESATVMSFNGRRVSLTNNVPSQQPISDAVLSVPVGRANTEHKVQLHAVTWLPMTVSSIEWVGQFFNNARRV